MKLHLTIVIYLLFIICNYGQTNSDGKNQIPKKAFGIIKKIELYKHLPCLEEYYDGALSNKWDDLRELENSITQEEAINLLEYSNQYVKGLAFFTLIRDSETKIFPILISNLNHHGIIEINNDDDYNDECILYEQQTSDFFITLAYISKKITKNQMLEIKRKIISENIKIEARNNFLLQSEPLDSLYKEIREIALEETNEFAIYALSKYQNEQDIFLIKKLILNKDFRYWGFSSVNNYLRPEFLPLIENYLKKEIKKRRWESTTYREAYEALVRYDNQKSLDIIKFILNKCKKRNISIHKKYIFKALKKYPSERFDVIYEELKNEKHNFFF